MLTQECDQKIIIDLSIFKLESGIFEISKLIEIIFIYVFLLRM